MLREEGAAGEDDNEMRGQGVSLQEQRDAIAEFALRNHFTVVEWFEETGSAARQGRKIFKAAAQKKQMTAISNKLVLRGRKRSCVMRNTE